MKNMKNLDIISYNEMCLEEGYSLQRGMNFQVNGGISVILMSIRKGAPYADKVEDNGETLIYEGHDVPKSGDINPKALDQQKHLPSGVLTQNGKFYNAAEKYKNGISEAELVKVYEKIKPGIWVYNGIFELVDSWIEKAGERNVFKFKLHLTNKVVDRKHKIKDTIKDLPHNRMIPTSVKLEVWKRDKGKCTECGSSNNLHFDHILPFSKGGTSLKADNIQLLCARHNLKKSDKIE